MAMDENTLRRPLLVKTLLEVLDEAGGPIRAGDALERVAGRVALNQVEVSRNRTGHQRYATALQFATTGMKKAGWLVKRDGTWRLTEPGRAELHKANDAQDLLQALNAAYATAAEDVDPQRPPRAWLLRGTVKGHNLVPGWLEEGFCSLAATRLGPLQPGVEQDEVRQAVDRDYGYLSYSAKSVQVFELHAFLSLMAPGDLVLTPWEGDIHLGVIVGDADQIDSPEGLSNLRRDVEWRTLDEPVDYADLPERVAARLSDQNTLVDLTAELDDLLPFLPVPSGEPVEQGQPEPVKPAEATLRDVTAELADELLLSRDFLQETVELLRERRQIIFYGPPGTGKTHLAQQLAWHLTDRSKVRLVQFHPAYSYEDFFEGFRPAASAEGSGVAFRLVPGPLRRLVDAAQQNPEMPYVLIIDEINRANLAKVFGELYFLLEYRNHTVSLTYSEDGASDFSMPKNVFIIGTMNTADRSIALVDAAMRRRFAFLELHPTEPPVADMLRRWLERHDLDTAPAALLDELNSRIEDRDFRIGPTYLMRPAVHQTGGLDRVWRTSILPLLVEHHYGESVDVAETYGLPALRSAVGPSGGP
jgi:5-methylcytosine-specific restriction protein B